MLLDYLCSIKDTDEEQLAAAELAMKHFKKANGMTDKMAGLHGAGFDGRQSSGCP